MELSCSLTRLSGTGGGGGVVCDKETMSEGRGVGGAGRPCARLVSPARGAPCQSWGAGGRGVTSAPVRRRARPLGGAWTRPGSPQMAPVWKKKTPALSSSGLVNRRGEAESGNAWGRPAFSTRASAVLWEGRQSVSARGDTPAGSEGKPKYTAWRRTPHLYCVTLINKYMWNKWNP